MPASASSSSSAYAFKPGGSLKFKGGESAAKIGKGKRRKARSSTTQIVRSRKGLDVRADDCASEEEEEATTRSQSSAVLKQDGGRSMTEAEHKFEQVRRKRLEKRVAREAKLSHKDRVDQFNKSLVSRSEHNDMLTVSGH